MKMVNLKSRRLHALVVILLAILAAVVNFESLLGFGARLRRSCELAARVHRAPQSEWPDDEIEEIVDEALIEIDEEPFYCWALRGARRNTNIVVRLGLAAIDASMRPRAAEPYDFIIRTLSNRSNRFDTRMNAGVVLLEVRNRPNEIVADLSAVIRDEPEGEMRDEAIHLLWHLASAATARPPEFQTWMDEMWNQKERSNQTNGE